MSNQVSKRLRRFVRKSSAQKDENDATLFPRRTVEGESDESAKKSQIMAIAAEIAGDHTHHKRTEQSVNQPQVNNSQLVNGFRQQGGE